jgi:putative flippase GtrA
VQIIVCTNYTGALEIYLSMIAGTSAGLVVKYILDKRYIFQFNVRDVAHDAQTFAYYIIMGLATTAVFWGFEFSFHQIFQTKEMRYLGGIIGLVIGYLTKYYLDKHYVFRTEAL